MENLYIFHSLFSKIIFVIMPFNRRNVVHNHRRKKRKEAFKKVFSFSGFFSFFSKIILFIQKISKKQILSLFLFLSISLGGYAGYAYIRDNSKDIIEGGLHIVTQTLGEDLQKNEKGMTNILLMGAGGENHEGGFLTDSLIVLTLNYELNSISMLSIPRDLHVRYDIEGRSRRGKINRVFMESMNYWKNRTDDQEEMIALSALNIRSEIEQIIGEDIQYTAYIDFQGFVKIVNQMGGIEVDLEKSLYDSQYPGPNHSYTIFSLPEGKQVLNGETALKYVRSRHGNSGGDFGRSHRQKKVIIALKNQAMESGIITSPSEIKSVLGIISEHFWTDISWQETLSLLAFVQQLNVSNITTGGIQDLTNEQKEWFLYTPPRDLFKGQSVLLPCRIYSKTPWSDITLYHSLLSEVPELINSKILSVYNTTKTAGLASELQIILNRFAINPFEVGNSKNIQEKSVIQYNIKGENAERTKIIAEHLSTWLNIPIAPQSIEDNLSANILEINELSESDSAAGVLQFTDTSEEIMKQEKNIEQMIPAEIIIYIGDDYVEKYRDDILWYRKCL